MTNDKLIDLQAEIDHLQKLLTIRRRSRRHLEEQAAKYGSLAVPTKLAHELHDVETEIEALETQLAALKSRLPTPNPDPEEQSQTNPPDPLPRSSALTPDPDPAQNQANTAGPLPRTPAPPHPRSPAQTNPFGDAGCLTDPGRFFDREELLRQIFEELGKGVNLSLVGESQVGKSSLLAMVRAWGPARLGLAAEAFAYLNLEWVDDEADFYEALCDALTIKTCRGYKLTRALRGKKYILGVDEIEKMAWDGFTVKLRSHLRGLADGHDAPFTLVIASRSPLARLFPDSPELDSPLAGICRQLDVGPFSAETTRAFIHHRLSGAAVAFTPADIDRLFTQSQGHPANLQHAAADLYRQYARRNPQSDSEV